jgi:hypothetical protein
MAPLKTKTLLSVDCKIGDIVATIALYEALHLAVVSLGEGPMPVGHSHLVEALLAQAKTSFKKLANKTIVSQISALVTGKGSTPSRASIKSNIVAEIRKIKTDFDGLVKIRTQMQQVIGSNMVSAIIKKAAKQPTVAKARAHVKKEAKRLGLCDDDTVQDYIE